MARPKKEEKPKDTKDSPVLQISIEDFIRTRDSVRSVYSPHLLHFCEYLPTRHDHNNNDNNNMEPQHLTIHFTNTSIAMQQQQHCHYMTRAQQQQAFESGIFLTNSLNRIVQHASAIIATAQATITGTDLTYIFQVVTGLATLQSAVQDLSRAYINHTNTVIGKSPGQSDVLGGLPLGTEGLFKASTAPASNNVEAAPETKKRKRVPHDKNAPKRPVTPYFLYMQTARSEIANEMPPDYTAKQVADEATRRWRAMTEAEKERTWGQKYQINFARYKEKSKAYKEGRPIPEISDEEAKELYDELVRTGKVKVEYPLTDDNMEEGQEEEEAETDDESEASSSEEEPEPEPIKAPSPLKSSRASKRQKGAAAEKKSSPVKQPAAPEVETLLSPAEKEVSKSPETERKKKGTKKKEFSQPKQEPVVAVPVSSPPKLSNQDSQQKPKKARKKRKSEAVEE